MWLYAPWLHEMSQAYKGCQREYNGRQCHKTTTSTGLKHNTKAACRACQGLHHLTRPSWKPRQAVGRNESNPKAGHDLGACACLQCNVPFCVLRPRITSARFKHFTQVFVLVMPPFQCTHKCPPAAAHLHFQSCSSGNSLVYFDQQ